MDDHGTHKAGTSPECRECHEAAYEPGWYAMLNRLSQRPDDDEELVSVPAAAFAIPAPPVATGV